MSVCNAVSFAHRRGILHRDIKPDNVMIGVFGEVTLLDWGIAVGLEADPDGRIPHFEAGGSLVGTPAYMAPEMLTRSEQSERTDVYLLGAVLYELLAGHPPHRGRSRSEMLRAFQAPAPLPADTPPTLKALCLRSLAVDPAERPASAAAFRAALQCYLDLRAVDAVVRAAEAQLEAAREAIAGQASRRQITEHLSSCQFGFSHALSQWPEHDVARERLDESLALAAAWALDSDNLQLAVYHLDQASRPDPALRARVDEALRAQEVEEGRTRALLAPFDPREEVASRSWAGVTFCLLATALSAYFATRAEPPTYLQFFGTSMVLVMVGLGATLIWRRAGRSNAYSRAFITAMVAVPIVQSLVDLGAWWRGWPPSMSHGIVMALLALVSLTWALNLDRRALLPALLWSALWLLSALSPETPYPFMATGTGLMILLALFAWRRP